MSKNLHYSKSFFIKLISKNQNFQYYSISLIVLIFANKILILKYKSKEICQKKIIFYSIKIEYFLKDNNKILNHLSENLISLQTFILDQIFFVKKTNAE